MTSTSEPAVRPSWIGVLLAPLWGMLRPQAACAYVAAASSAALAISLGLWLLVYGSVCVLLFLCREVGRWKPEFLTWSWALAGTWHDYHIGALGGWFGGLEVLALITMGLGLLVIVWLAWLHLPFVHRTGSVWSSYARALRASALVVAPLAVTTLVCGTIFVVLDHGWYRRGLGLVPGRLNVEPGIGLFICIAVSLWLLVWWLQQAIAGVAVDAALPALPSLCEDCGYDLTHQPAEGRCPECGLAIEASLIVERSRPGSAWAQRKTAASWLTTSRDVLRRPRAFYRRLRLRTPLAAEAGFAVRHYVWLACGGALWGGSMVVFFSTGPVPAREELNVALVSCGLVLSGVFGCWLGQRTIAALVTSWWLARRALPDTAWAAKIIVYETTFLWVFCAFWGVLIGSYAAYGAWLSQLIGSANLVGYLGLFFILGMPIEAWAVAAGTLALGVLWLWRYSVAYRAIRWSNF